MVNKQAVLHYAIYTSRYGAFSYVNYCIRAGSPNHYERKT